MQVSHVIARASVGVVVTLLFIACRADPVRSAAEHLVSAAHATMGAEVRVTIWASQDEAAQAAMAAVFREFDRLDRLLSIWKPGSDVQRLNASAGVAPVRVAPETREILRVARQISAWTAGKFDITFGALAEVWKFDHDQDNRVPTDAEIAARLPLIDSGAVVVDEGTGTAFVAGRGMKVHLGGIGKGYAIDRAVALLRGAGFEHFMVQAGGDLFVSGQPGNRPWRLGINDPRGAPNESFATIELRDRTFSTSGDYERFFIADGTRFHHLLDPDSGRPVQGCRSVTIVATTAAVADGLSTGVFIMGPVAGMGLIEQLPEVEGVIVSSANEVLISSGLRGRVHLHRPPTP